MKGRRKTFHDSLTGVRIDVLYGEPDFCSRILRKLGVDDDLKGLAGCCFNLRHEQEGVRRFVVWIRPEKDRISLAGTVAHEVLHLALGLQRIMNDADHVDFISGTNEETIVYHFEGLFENIWQWILKVSDSTESEDPKLES